MLKITLEIKNSNSKTGAGMVFVCSTPAEGEAARNAVDVIVAAAVDQMAKAEQEAEKK